MSATNRGGQRHPADFYRTPRWCIESVVGICRRIWTPTLDPCAGDGAIMEAAGVRGIELDPGRAATAGAVCGDGLAASWAGEHVILNPPFHNALEWVQKGMDEAESAIVLLRLAMLASLKRAPFWAEYPPDALCILSKRPAFVGGATDSCDYAWFIWAPQETGRPPLNSLYWINP